MKEIEKFDPNQIAIADAEQIKEVNASVLEATRACVQTNEELDQLNRSLNSFEETHKSYKTKCSAVRSKMQRIITQL